MSKVIVFVGLLASWSVWLLGNAIWVGSSAGTATGSALFAWLWVPGLVHSILLLLRPIGRRSMRFVGTLSALGMLGLAAHVLIYPWQRTEYLLQQAAAHSGVQISEIPDAVAQPAAFVALVALTLGATSILISSWSAPSQRKPGRPDSNSSDTAPDDPRTIWDSLSD